MNIPKDEHHIESNRSARKYSPSEMRRRIIWMLLSPFFTYSPRPAFAFRNWILRLLGAEIAENVHIYRSAIIYLPWNLKIGAWSSIGEWTLIYNLGKVTIGSGVTISQRVHLCAGTHDYRQAEMPLKKPPITIEDEAWICADSFIGPGVTIGKGAIAGACTAVFKDVNPWTIVGGNPAIILKHRERPPAEECSQF